MQVRICDCCKKINPKTLDNNERYCGEKFCVSKQGFYKPKGSKLGTNGKISNYSLQFPLQINWRGFFIMPSCKNRNAKWYEFWK